MRDAAVLVLAISVCAAGVALAQAQPVPDDMPVPQNDYLNAVIWHQTSAEYVGAARTAYAMASAALDRALENSSQTAAEEQTGDPSALPPAIIMDVDETVLDNGPFQGDLVKNDGARRQADMWAEWVDRAIAQPIPGADEFIAYAQSRGVTVFFVTNRDAEKEAATRRNLSAIGAQLPENIDTVLMEHEQPEWRFQKSSRRQLIAQTHRIVLLIGDDYGDFSESFRKPLADRRADAIGQNARWGSDWIMIPNPMYGSWERAAYNFQFRASRDQRRQMKYDAVETSPPSDK